EPMRYWVSAVAGVPASTSASPTSSLHTRSPPRTIAAVALGMRCSACAARSSAPRSRSRSGKCPQRARDQHPRPLDVVILNAEVRDGAKPPRLEIREEHALRREALERAARVVDGYRDEVGLRRLRI